MNRKLEYMYRKNEGNFCTSLHIFKVHTFPFLEIITFFLYETLALYRTGAEFCKLSYPAEFYISDI